MVSKGGFNACPECEVGKHGNCDGRAWDLVHDKYVECDCAVDGHESP